MKHRFFLLIPNLEGVVIGWELVVDTGRGIIGWVWVDGTTWIINTGAVEVTSLSEVEDTGGKPRMEGIVQGWK